jgi:ABC-2 type transport system permease protein
MLRVGFAEVVAYRAELLVWVLSTNMPLIMLALWLAVVRDGAVDAGGQSFGREDFIAYYLAMLVVRLLTGCWVVWALNMEIRQGTLALRLLRPIHPLVAYAVENISAIPMRGLVSIPVALVLLFTAGADHVTHDWRMLALFPVVLAGAWLITFLSMSIVGTLAFYIDSAVAVFEVWLGAFTALSGYVVPLAMYPEWVRRIANGLPFRYILGFPVELATGRLSMAQTLEGLAIQWAYVAGLFAITTVVWRAGVKRYAAFGG